MSFWGAEHCGFTASKNGHIIYHIISIHFGVPIFWSGLVNHSVVWSIFWSICLVGADRSSWWFPSRCSHSPALHHVPYHALSSYLVVTKKINSNYLGIGPPNRSTGCYKWYLAHNSQLSSCYFWRLLPNLSSWGLLYAITSFHSHVKLLGGR